MTHSDTTIAPLADLQWLRQFARVLARDADEADDLVQEALVATWKHGPAREGSLRPWLATVVRNLFRMRLRADARRERREQEAAATTWSAQPDHEFERLAVLKILLSEIEALPAEDRRILVRRFFTGEQAVDIGRELGIPAATIRSRLNRSLKRLRDRLDERCDGRKTWCAAVLVGRPALTTTPASAAKGGSMSVIAKGVIVMATAAAGAAGWLALGGPARESHQMVEETGDTPVAVAAPAEPNPGDPRRTAWERRKREIRQTLPPLPKPAPTPTPPTRHEALRASFRACMEDLGVKASGALTIDVSEIGAPDIGTIYESVEIVETTFPDQEVLTCLTESMLGWVGEAPAESFERRPRITLVLGEPADAAEKERRHFEAIVGAHVREVQFCEKKAPDTRGRLTLMWTMGEPQDGLLKAKAVTVTLSEVPQAVVDCAVAAGLRWAFPATMAGKSYEYAFVTPIGSGGAGK
ncbi:sigma-70 family RNA polymerase sigma factor [Nannocystis radixulma]|uniref:Sigma-70 family RNA polymerase sigma factor n=1 Tax=Nannocystis radixulma TaxID=2995305 RepID=A0ABT5AWS9_9BACT|nr:sigma-70 family RNA polymerase sigma factor [Nannocystis radixulma]MDC0666302.1 sigma-70 family RNA polymerase sigma factor [Nannocystis radixulma]